MVFEYDSNRYRGMSREEAREAEAEDRKRAAESDPGYLASVRAVERREAERKAEQQRQIDEAERRRLAEAAATLEEERVRLLRSWQANGGTQGEFDRAWPQLKERLLIDKVADFERERAAVAFRV